MILRDIKNIITRRGEVCLSEIYSSIDADRGLVDQALFELSGKGIITEINCSSVCRGCPAKCSSKGERIFRIS